MSRAHLNPLPAQRPATEPRQERTTGRAWFSVQTAWLARHSMVSSAAIGTAIRLHSACAGLMNGGRLVGAHQWLERQWLTLAHVDRDEVNAIVDAGLAEWRGYDLVLLDYDVDREKTYREQCARAAEARNGRHPGKP